MKVQIYTAILCFVWMCATAKHCEEANKFHYMSDLIDKAMWTILFGIAALPLVGRVFGWW